jgi:hypothetical protein
MMEITEEQFWKITKATSDALMKARVEMSAFDRDDLKSYLSSYLESRDIEIVEDEFDDLNDLDDELLDDPDDELLDDEDDTYDEETEYDDIDEDEDAKA